jgi:hypothetical protein
MNSRILKNDRARARYLESQGCNHSMVAGTAQWWMSKLLTSRAKQRNWRCASERVTDAVSTEKDFLQTLLPQIGYGISSCSVIALLL